MASNVFRLVLLMLVQSDHSVYEYHPDNGGWHNHREHYTEEANVTRVICSGKYTTSLLGIHIAKIHHWKSIFLSQKYYFFQR